MTRDDAIVKAVRNVGILYPSNSRWWELWKTYKQSYLTTGYITKVRAEFYKITGDQ